MPAIEKRLEGALVNGISPSDSAQSTKGEGRAVQPPERLQEDMLMAVSSYFLQRYLCYLTAPMFSALAIQMCCNMGNRKSGSTTPMIYLLTLSGNTTQDVRAVNAGTFSISHCPSLRDKGDIKFPL